MKTTIFTCEFNTQGLKVIKVFLSVKWELVFLQYTFSTVVWSYLCKDGYKQFVYQVRNSEKRKPRFQTLFGL